jgi:Fe-Mn family superoxide dismutase
MELPYKHPALEPYIDTQTMFLHHDKHLAGYVKKINAAFQTNNQSMPCLLQLQEHAIQWGKAFRDNGGGVYNHNLFFSSLAPNGTGGKASDTLSFAIRSTFGSFQNFMTQFEDEAVADFGSGWAWLVVNDKGQLEMTSTANQDNPLMCGRGPKAIKGIPILGVDVWEHAYYLLYQNQRRDYIKAWWNVVNWNTVNSWYEGALAGKAPAPY